MLCGFTYTTGQIAMPDSVCVGAARRYHVNDPSKPSTYTWQINGITQASTLSEINITWNTAGTFLLSVLEHSNNGCDADVRSGLVDVNPLPIANAGPDIKICFGNTQELRASGGTGYQWTPANYLSITNIANPVVKLRTAGTFTYFLNVTDAFGCKSVNRDSVAITMLPQVKIFAGHDTDIAINQRLQLNAIDILNSGISGYTWTPSTGLNNSFIKDPVAILSSPQTITYHVMGITADGCKARDEVTLKFFTAADIYMPNAFTPNGDGLNDIIKPTLSGIKELTYFTIYNRWGVTMFTTTIPGAGWNGLYKGAMQNSGAYVWMAKAVDYKGNILQRKGIVILIK